AKGRFCCGEESPCRTTPTGSVCCRSSRVCGKICCPDGAKCIQTAASGSVCACPGSTTTNIVKPCPTADGLVCCRDDSVCLTNSAGSVCCDQDRVCGNTCCADGQTCVNGVCRCPNNGVLVNGKCCTNVCKSIGPLGATICCPEGTVCLHDANGNPVCCRRGRVCGPNTSAPVCCADGSKCV